MSYLYIHNENNTDPVLITMYLQFGLIPTIIVYSHVHDYPSLQVMTSHIIIIQNDEQLLKSFTAAVSGIVLDVEYTNKALISVYSATRFVIQDLLLYKNNFLQYNQVKLGLVDKI